MTQADIVEMFETKRPIAVMAKMALDRLLCPVALEELFHETAEKQYEDRLLFSSLASLMASVVLCQQPSVHSAYKERRESLGVGTSALYDKLGRMETGLSQALVRYSYAQLLAVSDHLQVYEADYVAGYASKILDGNHLAATEHRLRETRESTAAPLPGKTLVVLDPRREAIADVFPIEDGHAQERSALDRVIETIQARELWIADRNFCTLKLMYAIDEGKSKFLLRKHAQLAGQPSGERRFVGETETGRVYEQALILPALGDQTLAVRQIEIELLKSTRDGDATLVLLTNLGENEADAARIAEIYRQRWKIETAFQKLTTNLECEVNTLCYPKAALFAFSLACLAYNAVAVVLAAIRAEHGQAQAAEISFHYMSQEIALTHDGMMLAIAASHWAMMRALDVADFATRLRNISRHIDWAYFRKSKRRPRKPKPKTKHQKRQVHVSTAQLLAKRQQ